MGKIISFEDYRKKKVEAAEKAEYNQAIRNILKLTEHLTTKNPKEGSDGKDEATRNGD